MNKLLRRFLLAFALTMIVSAIFYLQSAKAPLPETSNTAPIGVGSTYQELVNPSAYVNIESLQLADVIGKKVILLDFWTYSCINCQRTTPYLNAWYEKYEDDGLLIVGIHTPEFEFEKELENVTSAVEELGIEFPIVLDNDRATWTAYGNRYWPRKYLIDLNGTVVYDHIGEGNYEETEAEIQKALGLNEEMSTPEGVVEVDFTKVLSPETYLGSDRGENTKLVTIEPLGLNPGTAYLVGNWVQEKEYASHSMGSASVLYAYEAKNVYIVASATSFTDLNYVDVEVWLDGEYFKTIQISEETLYTVIEGEEYGAHTLKLIPKNPGLNLFTFTFG